MKEPHRHGTLPEHLIRDIQYIGDKMYQLTVQHKILEGGDDTLKFSQAFILLLDNYRKTQPVWDAVDSTLRIFMPHATAIEHKITSCFVGGLLQARFPDLDKEYEKGPGDSTNLQTIVDDLRFRDALK